MLPTWCYMFCVACRPDLVSVAHVQLRAGTSTSKNRPRISVLEPTQALPEWQESNNVTPILNTMFYYRFHKVIVTYGLA